MSRGMDWDLIEAHVPRKSVDRRLERIARFTPAARRAEVPKPPNGGVCGPIRSNDPTRKVQRFVIRRFVVGYSCSSTSSEGGRFRPSTSGSSDHAGSPRLTTPSSKSPVKLSLN